MTYTLDIVNLAITYLIQNISKVKIANMLKITRQTLYIWSIKYKMNIINKTHVTQNQLTENKIHKNTKINNYFDDIKLYVQNNEGCNLNDIYLHINKGISKSSICNALKKLDITRKKINNHIVCKDIDKIIAERTTFVNNLNFDINNAIYLDESSFCIDLHKTYGYSFKGKEINKLIRHKHNKQRYTLLAAIDNKQIINYKIFNGSVNSNKYLEFIKENNSKFKNKILLQDNARIHHAKIVKEYASKENILLKFNPAYSPEFNPIELLFNKCKIEFRKLDHSNLINDIEFALQTITSNDCQQFYNHTKKYLDKYII